MADQLKQSGLNRSRQDKFILYLNLPPILHDLNTSEKRGKDFLNLDSLQFSVYGSPVPSISVPEVDLSYGGQTIKLSSHHRPRYSNVIVNFMIDNKFNNYWVLWKWLDLLNNWRTSTFNEDEYKDLRYIKDQKSYQATINVQGLDEYNKPVINFIYNHAFIVNLGSINYDYREPQEISSSFEFSFDQLQTDLI